MVWKKGKEICQPGWLVERQTLKSVDFLRYSFSLAPATIFHPRQESSFDFARKCFTISKVFHQSPEYSNMFHKSSFSWLPTILFGFQLGIYVGLCLKILNTQKKKSMALGMYNFTPIWPSIFWIFKGPKLFHELLEVEWVTCSKVVLKLVSYKNL